MPENKIGTSVKGSMTVEAVFVVSTILLILLLLMNTTIRLCRATIQRASTEWVLTEQCAEKFRLIRTARDLLEGSSAEE